MSKSSLYVLAAVLLAVSTTACAQNSDRRAQARQAMMDKLKAADVNNDGYIDREEADASLPRVASHHQEWVDACLGKGATLSNFGYAAGLTEALLVGNLALRTGKAIEWDSAGMRAPNCPEADRFIRPEFRTGWSL